MNTSINFLYMIAMKIIVVELPAMLVVWRFSYITELGGVLGTQNMQNDIFMHKKGAKIYIYAP